ncbi:MAG TPA: DUF2795 domain-containing protein [Candidatus Paceibacterota bacterium]|nr:DUF2795 domain-containing protein [Candidatus Paceibacterota bacterium]
MANPIDVQAYLSGMSYPATKQDLISKANENSAPSDVTDALDGLPDNTYTTPAEVQSALSGSSEEGNESEA